MSRRGISLAAAVVAVVAAGCGSSGDGGGTTANPSRSVTTSPAAAGTGAGGSAAATTTRAATARRVADHHGRNRHRGGYGRIPSWLPSAKPPPQRPLHASVSHPVLTIQGDSLAISLGHARLLATAVGPALPENGRTPVPATSPVTFVITFSHVTAPVALHRSSFVLVDEQHQIHHPRVTTLHGGPPPSELRPGPPVSIELRSVLPAGDGGLEWRPAGERPIAGWDFNVEID